MANAALLKCGDGFRTIEVPYLGLPGMDQDPHGAFEDRPPGELQPPVMSLADSPQGPGPLPGVLGEVAQALSDVRQRFRLRIPGILDGPAAINLANHNVVVKLAVPSTGPFYPRAVFTYKSKATCRRSPYGAKWSCLFEQKVEKRGQDEAVVIKGDGSCWCYTDRDPVSGLYLAPDGAGNALERTADGWIETQPDGLELHYEELKTPTNQPRGVGRLATLQRHDQIWTLTYDHQSRLESITDPYDRLTSFTYTNGRLSEITDHAGRQTQFQIDCGCLTAVTLPESTVTSFVYDARGRLLAHVAPGGSRTSYSYDNCGHVETVMTPKGEVTTFTVVDCQTTRVTDARSHVTTVTFDEDRYLQTVTNPLGYVTSYTWHGNHVSGIVDANGHDTHLTFTALANRTQGVSGIVYGNSDTFSIDYDGNDRVEQVTNPRGYATTLTWDDYDRTVLRDPLDQRITFTYNDAGQLKTQDNEEGHTTTLEYDDVGLVTVHLNPLSERTSYTYNSYEQRETVENPEGHVFTTTYDALNRPTAQITPLGHQTDFSYAPNTLLESTRDPEGHTTTTLYDANHRVEATIDALNQRTSYAYDPVGNQVSVANPLGYVTTSVYDAANQRIARINPLNLITSFGYDPVGNQTSVKNPEGHVATTVYDERDRVVAQVDPLNHCTSFTYDGSNNLLRIDRLLQLPVGVVNEPRHLLLGVGQRGPQVTRLILGGRRVPAGVGLAE